MQRIMLPTVLGFCSAFCMAQAASGAPQEFTAYIGGFLGQSYTVDWNGRELRYSVRGHGKTALHATLRPTEAQWQAFRSAVERAGVSRWRPKYFNSRVMDGTQWSLRLKDRHVDVQASGSNSYPLADGQPNDTPEFSAAFEAYLKGMEALLGGRTFR